MDALHPVFDVHGWNTPDGPRTFSPMFDALTFIDSAGQLRPALALAWSRLQPTVWQFRLRASDAKFQNGEFFNPESAQLSIQRAVDPTNNLALTPLVSTIDHVDIVDDATINVVTGTPDAILPWRASLIYMLPARAFVQAGAAKFFQQPIGTGQWQFQDFSPDTGMTCSFFTDTWRAARGEPIPPIKQLRITVQPPPADRAAALKSGSVDIAVDLAPGDAASLAASGFPTIAGTPGVVLAYAFNTSPGSLFANLAARQAANLALDREQLLKRTFGDQAILATQLTASGATGYNASLNLPAAADSAAAKRLLSALHTAGNAPTPVWATPGLEPVAQALALNLQAAGLPASTRSVSLADYLASLSGTHLPGLFPLRADYALLMDAEAAYFRWSSAATPAMRLGSDANLASLLQDSRGAEGTTRARLLGQAAARWQAQSLGLPLLRPRIQAATAPGIKGLSSLASGAWWFDRVLK